MFFNRKPNREIYKTQLWKEINPLDRAHILLVAEGVKSAAHTNIVDIKQLREPLERELGIWIEESSTRRDYRPFGRLLLPSKVFTIARSKKIINAYSRMLKNAHFQVAEGRMLGYPKCCTREYVKPTFTEKYSPLILKEFKKPYTFLIEGVKTIMENKKIPTEFNYLMPAQTPCSIHCKYSIHKLRKYKHILHHYDPLAEKYVIEFNKQDYHEMGKIAKRLRAKNITPEMFRKGYVITK